MSSNDEPALLPVLPRIMRRAPSVRALPIACRRYVNHERPVHESGRCDPCQIERTGRAIEFPDEGLLARNKTDRLAISGPIVMLRSAWDASTAPPSLYSGTSAQLAGTAQVNASATKTTECNLGNLGNMGKLLETGGHGSIEPNGAHAMVCHTQGTAVHRSRRSCLVYFPLPRQGKPALALVRPLHRESGGTTCNIVGRLNGSWTTISVRSRTAFQRHRGRSEMRAREGPAQNSVRATTSA
jgi:hypothetical protein